MTTLSTLWPIAFALLFTGGTLTWPVAHRVGRHTAEAAMLRDEAEVAHLLDGVTGQPALEPPTRPGRYKGRRRRTWLGTLGKRWRSRRRAEIASVRWPRLTWADVT